MMKPAGAVDTQEQASPAATVCAAPSLPPGRSPTRIERSGPLAVPVRAAATAAWIAVKYLLLPVLYIPYRLGVATCWAYRIDAYMRRTLLPLTELPDERISQHIAPRIRPAELAPHVPIKYRGQIVDLYGVAPGRQLLLIVYRGSWCSYSQLHIADAAAHADQLRRRGVEILAVSSRRDERWWTSKGIDLRFAADSQGALFEALGVKAPQSLSQKVWGTLVPYESVFLFDADRRLVACDVRNVSNTRMRQRFVSTKAWLDLCEQRADQ
jgi:peroxiredoxin